MFLRSLNSNQKSELAHQVTIFFKHQTHVFPLLLFSSAIMLQKIWKNSRSAFYYYKWPWIFSEFRIKLLLRTIFEIFGKVLQWRFDDHVTLPKISKNFLRRKLTLKILKKCMVIYGIKISFCNFFSEFSSWFALEKKS